MKSKIQIALKPYNHKIFYGNRIFKLNNGHNAFFGARSKLAKSGIQIDTIDVLPSYNCDWVIYADMPYPWQIYQWINIIFSKTKKILICLESPLINPFNHFKSLHIFFEKIFTWNDEYVDNKKYFKVFIPQLKYNKVVPKVKFKRKKLLVAVYSNKEAPVLFGMINPFRSNMYGKRNESIGYFEKNLPDDFDLYGRGWSKPKKYSFKENILGADLHENYKGEVDDKINILTNYKFCLAYENSLATGYITEKIFDCFKAGCVPIYLGANNVSKYIPKGCFIDANDFDNHKDLLRFLRSMSENEYSRIIKSIKNFLSKNLTKERWSQNSFLNMIIKVVN